MAAPVRNLAGIRNRDNTADIALQAQIVGVQTPVEVRCVRVVLPVDEGSDLVSAWNDGNWNGAAPPAIPDDLKTKVWRLISSTGTVPNVPVPAGVAFYGYRGAIKDLQAALGAYCSYCETRQSGADNHDVEHRLAKASYHSDILLWSNYLLGCKMCNEYSKGERPGRQFGITNAITAFHTGANAPPNPIVYPVVGVPANYAVSPVIPPGPARIRYDEMRRASQLYQL